MTAPAPPRVRRSYDAAEWALRKSDGSRRPRDRSGRSPECCVGEQRAAMARLGSTILVTSLVALVLVLAVCAVLRHTVVKCRRHVINHELAGGEGAGEAGEASGTVPAVFLLNLRRRPDRLDVALRSLGTAGLAELTLVVATDGSETPESTRLADAAAGLVSLDWDCRRQTTIVSNAPCLEGEHTPLSAGEYGCAMSHVRIWRAIAAAAGPADAWSVVLEDDAVPLQADAVQVLLTELTQEGPALSGRADIVYFGGYPVPTPHISLPPGEHVYYRPEHMFSTLAYALTRGGARRLLRALPVSAPVDCFVSYLAADGRLRSVVRHPLLLGQIQWGGGDIDESGTASEKAQRGLLRTQETEALGRLKRRLSESAPAVVARRLLT